MNKKALITGVTGQDGSYLSEFLIKKGYEVHGIARSSSSVNTMRVDHLTNKNLNIGFPLMLHHGDMTDSMSLLRIMKEVRPDEIYNLAAQSHVAVSFEEPEYTANSDALGTLRMLEAIRILKMEKDTKFYQASTSELFGLVHETPQTETTPFYPRSPYAVAKLYAYWITVNYREAYGMYACNGILFNHESPVRGEYFVTRKITMALSKIKCGSTEVLRLGNLNSRRDWGHAQDYVEMQWLMLQQDIAQDFVISTGEDHSVREFATIAAMELGMTLHWTGEGINEKGYIFVSSDGLVTNNSKDNKKVIIEIDAKYFRPTEVDALLGNAQKAIDLLGWKPKISFNQLVSEMVQEDLKLCKENIKSI